MVALGSSDLFYLIHPIEFEQHERELIERTCVHVVYVRMRACERACMHAYMHA